LAFIDEIKEDEVENHIFKTVQEQSDCVVWHRESLGLQFIEWRAEHVRERNLEVHS
jgi:hypothetical protein